MPLGRPLFASAWTLPADRKGRRHAVTLLSCWLSAGAFALYLVPRGFWGLALVTLLVAAMHAPIHALVEATVLDATRRIGVPYGRVRVWGSIGFVVASACMGAALGWWTTRSILWAALGTAIATALAAHALPRPPAVPPRARTSLKVFLMKPGVAAFYAASMLMQASHGAYYTFYSIHMAAQGHPGTTIGALWALGVISEMVVMVWFTRLFARAPASAILKACYALAAVRWLLYSSSASLGVAIPAQILHAFTYGAFHIAAVTATHRIFPEDLRASGQAIYGGLTFGLGSVVGAMTAGILYDIVGPFRMFIACTAFAVAGGALIAVAARRIPAMGEATAHPVEAPEPEQP